MRGAVTRLTWELDVVDRGNSTRKVLQHDRQIREGLQATDRQYGKTARAATASAAVQSRASRKAADDAQRAALAEARAALRVEAAHEKASRAADRYGTKSTQAKRAALDLSDAQRRLAAATRDAGDAAVTLARREDAAARAQTRRARATRTMAGAVGRGAARGVGGAAGAAGTIASRAGYGAVGVAAAGTYAGVRAIRVMATEYNEARVTAAATNAVIKSTGGVANVTGRDVDRLSDRLSRKAAIDDELIAKGANMLLTFKNVRNETGKGNAVFNRTTSAAVDMSAAFTAAGKSMDVTSATLMLGKALQDPEKGLTRLSRAGITFSDSQRDMVEDLVASNNTLGAQKVILTEVESQFGGTARKTRQPIDQLRVGFAGLAEDLGKLGAPDANKGIRAVSNFVNNDLRKIAQRKDLSITEKLGLSVRAARDEFGPFVNTIIGKIRDAKLGDRLVDGIETALPVLIDRVAAAAPRAAGAFIGAFMDLGPWGKLLTVAFLAKKLGAFPVIGRMAATKFTTAFATSAAPGVAAAATAAGAPAGAGFGGKAASAAGKALRAAGWVGIGLFVADQLGLDDAISNELSQAFGSSDTELEKSLKKWASNKLWQEMGETVGAGVLDGVALALDGRRWSTSGGRWFEQGGSGTGRSNTTGDGQGGIGRGRRGGRFQGGGMVPAFVSSGELIVEPGGSAWRVPGQPVAADNVFTNLVPGSAVLTWDGQARMAMGASLNSALATQAPHFRAGGRLNPGQMATLAYRQGKIRPESSAIRMGAIGMRESRGDPEAHNYDPPRDDSWGLWQVNVLPHANPQYKGWKLDNPAINATATGRIFNDAKRMWGDPFRPWGGYSTSSYSGWLDDARRGFRRDGSNLTGAGTIGTSDRTTKVPIRYRRDPLRGGLIDDAFSSALEARRAGEPIGRRRFLGSVREALAGVETTRDLTIRGGAKRSTGDVAGPGADRRVRRMSRFAGSASRRWPNYVYGGGHGTFSGPYDCSGYVSAILHAGGLTNTTMTTDGLKTWGRSGNGRAVTIGVRGTTGRGAHTMMKIGSSYWEAGSSGVGRRSGWSGSFPIRRHPKGYRRGGVVADRVPTWLRRRAARPGAHDPRSPNFVGFGLAGGGRIDYGGRGAVYDPRAGGPPVGPRIGLGGIGGAANGRELDTALQRFSSLVENAAVHQVEALRKRLARAVQRSGDAKLVTRLQAALSVIDDKLGRRIGRILHSVDVASSRAERGAGRTDRMLRVAGTAPDSVTGLETQLAAEGGIYNAARANVGRLQRAIVAAQRAGQHGVARQLKGELEATVDQLDESFTRQIELRRDIIAAAAADRMSQAQELVDAASSGFTLEDLGLRRMELEQRIAGTFDTGGQQRADYIRSEIVPAIEAEIGALQNQQREASSQGDQQLVRQLAEAIATRENDKLQAIVDATEQTAENTEALRRLGGTLGFGFGSETLTDALIGVGNGS